jgi:putative redox protein
MEGTLSAEVTWTGKMHFEGRAEFPHSVPLDYAPPLGDGAGLRPMDLILLSLASCSGQTTISLLQKMKQDVKAFSVKAVGTKVEGHPTVFSAIHLTFAVSGTGLDPAMVEKAIRLSEEKYCPVWAMLKPGVRVTSSFELTDPA